MNKLRFGILGTANIARKNWKAILHSGNAVVTAVASRDIGRSRAFINDCQREFSFRVQPAAFGSYEALLASEVVDAVYIPLPTGLRKEWVIRAAQAGKHVLCEKPCAVNSADLEEMIAACKKHRVQFMDGVMFMHSPRLAKVRQILDDGKSIGEIRRISSVFSFYSGGEFFRNNIRVDKRLEPAGSLGDLGWYCVRFALWTMKWKMPHAVTGKILSPAPRSGIRPSAPTELSGELFFDDNVSAGFYCSFRASFQEWIHVSGQNGWLRLPDFVHPFDSYRPAFEVNRREVRVGSGPKCPPGVDPMEQGHRMAQDARMIRNFADQVFSGRLNADWPMWVLKTQQVVDACLEAARRGRLVEL